MKISARNQFEGTISSVVEGSVNGVVTIDFEGYVIKADITMESIKGLELAEGKKAFAIIKASNVMFAAGSEPIKNISARNQLVGTITSIKEGARARRRQQGHRLYHQRGHRVARPGRGRESRCHHQVDRRHGGRGIGQNAPQAIRAAMFRGDVRGDWYTCLLHRGLAKRALCLADCGRALNCLTKGAPVAPPSISFCAKGGLRTAFSFSLLFLVPNNL